MADLLDRLKTALADRYAIERELGFGGMATVYLARDLKHDRRVALKVLKPELAAVLGAERFVVEIKTTASLQHPHILPLFDSGTAEGFLYYVMPFIDGETLRAKLNRETQLSIAEAVKITTAVADALDYAHRHGVIHRDIKPENILLHDGRPVVADFGIALAVSAAAGGRMTETGLSLGTPHYMSPEQATADKEITGRSDIYSLGSVLYEMLTGEPPHLGNSAQQIIMKIIAEPVKSVTALRKSVPPNVAAAVGRALEKLPADRFATAAAFATALLNPSFTTTAASAISTPAERAWHRDWRIVTLLGTLLVAIASSFMFRKTYLPPGQVQFTFTPPPGYTFGTSAINFAIAPDGRAVAFLTRGEGTTRLFVRRMDRVEAEPIVTMPGLYQATAFSPDGKSVAFARSGSILRVSAAGGTPVLIGKLTLYPNTMAWPTPDTIIVTGGGALWAMSVRTGISTILTIPDSAHGEIGHRAPVIAMPDGRWVFTVDMRAGSRPALLSRDRKSWTYMAGDLQGWVRGFTAGYLVVEQSNGTVAVPISSSNASTKGDALLLEPNGKTVWVSPAGTLVAAVRRTIARPEWVDQSGKRFPLALEPHYYAWPRLSPDGRKLSISQNPPGIVVDLVTGRVTTLPGSLGEAIWTRDGTMLTGRIPSDGRFLAASQRIDGSAAPELMARDSQDHIPTSWSRDGRFLLAYGAASSERSMDLAVLGSDGKWTGVVTGPGDQKAGMLSPDGHWFAYTSDESGRAEVYLRPWPANNRQWIVSTGGGSDPVWSKNGSELYYLSGDRVMTVTVQGIGEPTLSIPRQRFAGPFLVQAAGDQSYDVAPDGRLIMLFPAEADADLIKVTLNWSPVLRE